jgi:hypothetical protein
MNFLKNNIIDLFILPSFALIFSLRAVAQDSPKGPEIFISPRITIGYTFHSGLNYGFDAVIGMYKFNDFKFGIDLTYYMINTDQGHHRIKGIAMVAENDYFCIKLGAGSVSRRWGLKNVNKAGAPGLMFDVSGSIGEDYAPWIGLKGFIFDHNRWQFYDRPIYFSGYTYFKSPKIMLLEKDTETTQ